MDGDILLESSGGGSGKPVGRIAFFEAEVDSVFLTSNFFRTLRPDSRVVTPRFLRWKLLQFYKSPAIWLMQQQTTGIINLKYKDYLRAEIDTPPLPEQQKIAEVLDTVDEAIRKTDQIIAKLKQVKQGLLHDLLTRGIDDNGELRDPERHPEQFKDSPLGRIPREWDVVSVLDIADPNPGSTTIGPFGSNLVATDYRSEGVPVIFVRDIREEGFAWRSNVYVSSEKARSLAAHDVRAGDVLVTKMGDPPGVSCVYLGDMVPGVITADVIRIRVNRARVFSEWVSDSINTERFCAQVRAAMGGVTRSKLTLSDFRRLLLNQPRLHEQSELIDRLRHMGKAISQEVFFAAKLRLLKQALMHDLLTGQVRVTNLLESPP